MPNPRLLVKYTPRKGIGSYLAAVNPDLPAPTPPHLPARRPHPPALLRRTQGTRVVHEVTCIHI